MTRKWRKTLAICSVLAGLALIFFELRRATTGGGWESYFWLGVGVMVMILGAIDLFGHEDLKED